MKFKNIFKKNKAPKANPEFIVTPKNRRANVVKGLKVGTVLRALFFFLLVTVPIGIFAWIIYHSSGLNIYEASEIWNKMDVPNAHNIFILFWVGMGSLISTVLMICLYGVVTRTVYDKRLQTAYVFAIIFFAVAGILLCALSQYFYAKFYDFYLYEARTTSTENLQPWAKDLSAKLIADYNDGNSNGIFDWMQSSVVWWVMFVQFMFVFGVEVTLQNALNTNTVQNDYEKYIADTKQVDAGIDFSKVNRFFKNMFKNDDKNVAKFLIIAAVVVVIPNFIYSIIGTVESSNMQSVIAWGYKIPTLIHDMIIDPNSQVGHIMSTLDQSRYGSVFVVSSLPIIFEGLTIATLFLFIAMLLRGKNVSNRIFIAEATVLFIEVIVLVSVALVSKIYVHRLTDYWQSMNGNETNLQAFVNGLDGVLGSKDLKSLGDMYPLNGTLTKPTSFHVEWLNNAATIAEAVIAYAWVFGTFTLITNNIYRLGYFKKANLTTYKTGILNS